MTPEQRRPLRHLWHLSDRQSAARVLDAADAWERDPGTRDEPNWQASARLVEAIRAYRAHAMRPAVEDYEGDPCLDSSHLIGPFTEARAALRDRPQQEAYCDDCGRADDDPRGHDMEVEH